MRKTGWALFALTALVVVPGAVPREAKAGPSPIVARMTLSNGDSRMVSLEGVGCSEAMCSRVAVRSRAEGDSRVTRTWLDTLTAIEDITKDDARFVFKDGTERRQSVVSDNRFLYFVNQNGRRAKVDLAGITSIEFLEMGRSAQ